jgi:RNA polymerase sigma-70 factor (ECF subfamily)
MGTYLGDEELLELGAGMLAGEQGLACRTRPEASDRDDPAKKFLREELVGCVYAAFTRIAPAQRAVLVLRAVEEKDYERIARSVEIPLGTVRSRLSRSRKAIGALLRPLLEEDDDESREEPD